MCSLIEWLEIPEGGGKQFRLGICEIAAGFGSQHFERIDHRLGGRQIDGFHAGVRVGDLAEKQPGVLGLQDDELVESRIRRGGHGGILRRDFRNKHPQKKETVIAKS